MKNVLSSTFCAFALALFASPVAADDFDYWQVVNIDWYKAGSFSTRTHAEFRFVDTEDIQYYRISQKFNYKASSHWTFGLHPTIERSRSASSNSFRDFYRLDIEANPSFKLGDTVSVKMRNRYEVRRRENSGSESYDRFRNYTKASMPADWLPKMTAFGIGNEIFYSFRSDRFVINRFYPAMLTFKPAPKAKLDVWLMWQTRDRGDGWYSDRWVLGTSLTVGF